MSPFGRVRRCLLSHIRLRHVTTRIQAAARRRARGLSHRAGGRGHRRKDAALPAAPSHSAAALRLRRPCWAVTVHPHGGACSFVAPRGHGSRSAYAARRPLRVCAGRKRHGGARAAAGADTPGANEKSTRACAPAHLPACVHRPGSCAPPRTRSRSAWLCWTPSPRLSRRWRRAVRLRLRSAPSCSTMWLVLSSASRESACACAWQCTCSADAGAGTGCAWLSPITWWIA